MMSYQQHSHAVLPVGAAAPVQQYIPLPQQPNVLVPSISWQHQRPVNVQHNGTAAAAPVGRPLSGAELVAALADEPDSKPNQPYPPHVQQQQVHAAAAAAPSAMNGVPMPAMGNGQQPQAPIRLMTQQLFQVPARPPPPPQRRSMIDECVNRDERYWRNRVTLKMDVAFTDHSHIIGRSGKNTQAIMRDTGCHIHFPDSNKNRDLEKSNQVSIAGIVSEVEKARTRVRSLAPLSVVFALEKLAPNLDVNDLVEHPCLEQVYSCSPLNVIVRHDRPNPVASCIVRGSVHQEQQLVQAVTHIANQLLMPGAVPVFQLMLEVLPAEQRQVIGYEQRNVLRISSMTGVVIKYPTPAESHRGATSFMLYASDIKALLFARKYIIGLLPVHLTFDVRENLQAIDLSALEKQLGVNLHIKSRHTPDRVAVQSVTVRGIEYKVQNLYEARAQLLGDTGCARIICDEYAFMQDFPLAPPLSQGSILTAYPTTPRLQPAPLQLQPQQRPMSVAPSPVYLASPAPNTPRMLVPWPPQAVVSVGGMTMSGTQSPVVAIRSPHPYSPVPCTHGGQFSAAGVPLPSTPTPPPPPTNSSAQNEDSHQPANGAAVVKQEMNGSEASNSMTSSAASTVLSESLAAVAMQDTPKAATADTSANTTPANEPNVHIGPVHIRLPGGGADPHHTRRAVANAIDPNPKNSPLASGVLKAAQARGANGQPDWRAVGTNREHNDYMQQRVRAHRAMQQEPTGMLRRPDQQWCGLGFSESLQVASASHFNASQQQLNGRGHDDSLMEQLSRDYHEQEQAKAVYAARQYAPQQHNQRVIADFGATTIFDEAASQQQQQLNNGNGHSSSVTGVEFILRQLNLAYLIPAFRENEIDYDTMMGLQEHEVAELVKKMGDRKKLLGAIQNIRRTMQRLSGWTAA